MTCPRKLILLRSRPRSHTSRQRPQIISSAASPALSSASTGTHTHTHNTHTHSSLCSEPSHSRATTPPTAESNSLCDRRRRRRPHTEATSWLRVAQRVELDDAPSRALVFLSNSQSACRFTINTCQSPNHHKITITYSLHRSIARLHVTRRLREQLRHQIIDRAGRPDVDRRLLVEEALLAHTDAH